MAQKPTRRTSMVDVAIEAGVSHQTVSRVLNNPESVRPETRERVNAAIKLLDYQPNIAARTLASKRSGSLGLISAGGSLFGPVSAQVAIEEAATEAGYFVSIVTVDKGDNDQVRSTLEHLASQMVEGIVAIAPRYEVAEAIDDFGLEVPIVLVGGPENESSPFHTVIQVSMDHRLGAIMAVNHLLDLGHKTVLHISGPAHEYGSDQRIIGWREALTARGAPIPKLIHASWSIDDGYRVGRELAPAIEAGTGPTAIFAANDQLAFGLYHALWEHGLSVPQDVSIVGFDDDPIAKHQMPPLTTVRQHFTELGQLSVEILLQAVHGEKPAPANIEPTLIKRDSTAAPRKNKR